MSVEQALGAIVASPFLMMFLVLTVARKLAGALIFAGLGFLAYLAMSGGLQDLIVGILGSPSP